MLSLIRNLQLFSKISGNFSSHHLGVSSCCSGALILVLVFELGCLAPNRACAQSACAQLGVDCSHHDESRPSGGYTRESDEDRQARLQAAAEARAERKAERDRQKATRDTEKLAQKHAKEEAQDAAEKDMGVTTK